MYQTACGYRLEHFNTCCMLDIFHRFSFGVLSFGL